MEYLATPSGIKNNLDINVSVIRLISINYLLKYKQNDKIIKLNIMFEQKCFKSMLITN
jgi:hypothetical protein